MDLKLAGKRAIVTGGSRGIGKAIALQLAREGVDLVLAARGREALDAAAAELVAQTGRRILGIPVNTADKASVDAMVEGAIAALYFNLSDVAPMGDDAKITDMMPFWNTYGYMPTEISVATGGYEKRGSLFAWAWPVAGPTSRANS